MPVIRALSQDRKIRVYYVDITDSVNTIAKIHGFGDGVRQLFAEVAVGTLLLSTDIKSDGYTFSSVLKCTAPYNTTVVVHDSQNRIKGYSSADICDKYDFKHNINGNAVFTIVIDTGTKYPYVTQLPICNNSLEECISNYMECSQQQKSIVKLACSNGRAVGVMLQPVLNSEYNCIETRKDELLHMTDNMLKTKSLYQLQDIITEHSFDMLCEYELSAECDCNEKKIEGVIVSLGKAEALKIIDDIGAVEVTCPYCLKKYSFDKTNIERLFANEE